MKNIKKFMINALLLCGVSFFMRTVGVSFNIYVSNKAGAEAMGLYSLLSGVYGFALTFATSGINLATMRMVSEALGKEDHGLLRASMRKCLLYSLSFSAAATVVLFFSSGFIGSRLLEDARTDIPLKILSLTLIPISLSSVFNGYFTAVRKVYKNAIIQVAEQAAKIFSISYLLTILLPKGTEYACIALAAGGGIAESLSLLYSATAFLIDKKRNIRNAKYPTNNKQVTKKLFGIALPIAFSTYARSGLITVEHLLIPSGLKKYGKSASTSLVEYGVLQGMVLPIIFFPSAIITSFSGLLIPELTECSVRKNHREIRYICERVLQLSLVFSVGVGGIILCFSGELGKTIYPNENTSGFIKMLAPLIPIMYIDTTIDSMLKGLGEQLYNMTVNIVDSLLSVILVWLLIPKYGIIGYVITIYVTEIINASLSMVKLINKSGLVPHLLKWVAKPLLCILGATCISNMLFHVIKLNQLTNGLRLTIHIIFTVAVYLAFLVATSAFDKDDILWLIGIVKDKPTNNILQQK